MCNVIIGLGTGRCGTVSLSKLLNYQFDSHISHELFKLSWITDLRYFKEFELNINNRNSAYVGDVASWLLPYANNIIEKYPNSKFIILKREKEEVITSFLKKTVGRNHWQSHNGIDYKFCRYDKCFPKFSNDLTKAEAIGKYWEEYYRMCNQIDSTKCYWLNTEDLNDETECIKMLEFCGFDNPQFIKIKTNESK